MCNLATKVSAEHSQTYLRPCIYPKMPLPETHLSPTVDATMSAVLRFITLPARFIVLADQLLGKRILREHTTAENGQSLAFQHPYLPQRPLITYSDTWTGKAAESDTQRLINGTR